MNNLKLSNSLIVMLVLIGLSTPHKAQGYNIINDRTIKVVKIATPLVFTLTMMATNYLTYFYMNQVEGDEKDLLKLAEKTNCSQFYKNNATTACNNALAFLTNRLTEGNPGVKDESEKVIDPGISQIVTYFSLLVAPASLVGGAILLKLHSQSNLEARKYGGGLILIFLAFETVNLVIASLVHSSASEIKTKYAKFNVTIPEINTKIDDFYENSKNALTLVCVSFGTCLLAGGGLLFTTSTVPPILPQVYKPRNMLELISSSGTSAASLLSDGSSLSSAPSYSTGPAPSYHTVEGHPPSFHSQDGVSADSVQ